MNSNFSLSCKPVIITDDYKVSKPRAYDGSIYFSREY